MCIFFLSVPIAGLSSDAIWSCFFWTYLSLYVSIRGSVLFKPLLSQEAFPYFILFTSHLISSDVLIHILFYIFSAHFSYLVSSYLLPVYPILSYFLIYIYIYTPNAVAPVMHGTGGPRISTSTGAWPTALNGVPMGTVQWVGVGWGSGKPETSLSVSLYIIYNIIYHINNRIIYHLISYHIISYHIVSYHIISYHIISYINNHIIYQQSDHISFHESYHISYII